MAKRIVVTEGEKIKTISNVSKLVTHLSNNDMCIWIPEDEVRLITKMIVKDGTYAAAKELGSPYGYSQVTVNGIGSRIMGDLGEISIDKNGTYYAKDDKSGPFYGYSKVHVSISGGGSGSPSSVSGKDGDGDDATASPDPDTGAIVYNKIPSRIEITTPPTKLVYQDGESIDFTGAVVKAYLETGGEYGVVPNAEITLNPTMAAYDASSEIVAGGMATSELKTGLTQPIRFYSGSMSFTGPDGLTGEIIPRNGSKYVLVGIRSGVTVEKCIWVINETSDGYVECISNWTYQDRPYTRTFNYRPRETYTYDGKTAKYSNNIENSSISNYRTPDITVLDINDVSQCDGPSAWTILYGDIVEISAGSAQTITVSWPRPGDNKVLETTFTITVEKPDDGGSSDFPPQPE